MRLFGFAILSACAAACGGTAAGASAEWIKPRTGSYADADVGVFRKAIPLDGEIRRAELKVAALGAFEAKVNGKVLPGYLNGGFTQPEKCRHECSFDVTSALCGGGKANVIEVEVSASCGATR